jgi:hypothetical protein
MEAQRTLCDLTVQIRQNTVAITNHAEQESSQWRYELNKEAAMDGELLELYIQGLEDIAVVG